MVKLEPLPNEEAMAFWKDKVKLSPGQFSKLTAAEKVHAFGISGIAKGAELESVFNALSSAIENGDTYEQFRSGAADVFERRGWTGVAAWRVDNIFRTNIQTAFSVGRYQQMIQATGSRPYWQYDAVNDARTRPTHRAMDGKVFRFDHAFWDSWYPPNGFRCRCSTRSLSQREIDRDGLTVETEDPTGTLVEPKTPEGVTMPARMLMPDPGFKHHPGKSVWGGVAEASGKPGKWIDMPDLKGPADFRRRKLANVQARQIADLDESMLLEAGLSDEAYRDEFVRRYGEEKVIADAAGEPAILSPRIFMADKDAVTWKFGKPGHGETIPLVEDLLTNPYEVWLVPRRNEEGRIRLTRRYIGMWKTADKARVGGMAVMEVSDGVWQGVTHFAPRKKRDGDWDLSYVERQRKGILLWGR